MKTLLICHHDAPLDLEGLTRWMASFSELVGVIVVRESGERQRKRIRNEIRRVGRLRFLDVLAFRAYARARLAPGDAAWERATLAALRARYPALDPRLPRLATATPNSPEARQFITSLAPDLMIARCKALLAERIFTIPPVGTFVLHPGVCPEYRNAHGGFWALANDDLEKVGVTLLKIDKGIDTGPVYDYFTYQFDELHESPAVIQQRCLFDNLGAVAERLAEVRAGCVRPIDTRGRPSGEWGQPWLTQYLRWRRRARLRAASGMAR